MSGLAEHAQILAGILVQHHGQMQLTFIILLDGLDDRNLSGQREIEDIATRAGTQPDTRPLLHLDARNGDALRRSFFLKKLKFPFVHRRSTPCIFMNCSTGIASVRSRIWRARSSPEAISSFSSAVRVMIRSVRISSISVPSNRAPGLSGAIWG